jgi:hypothetical protein
VAHQHAHGGLVTGGLGANAHRVCHVFSPSINNHNERRSVP